MVAKTGSIELVAKVVGLEDFDDRIDRLLELAGVNPTKVCLWDYNGGCTFGNNGCRSGMVTREGTSYQKSYDLEDVAPTSIFLHILTHSFSGAATTAQYEVFINDNKVADQNQNVQGNRNCNAATRINIAETSIDQYFVAGQSNTLKIKLQNPDRNSVRESEYWAEVGYV